MNSSPAEVAAFIAKRDKAFRPIIALAGPPPLRRRAERVDEDDEQRGARRGGHLCDNDTGSRSFSQLPLKFGDMGSLGTA